MTMNNNNKYTINYIIVQILNIVNKKYIITDSESTIAGGISIFIEILSKFIDGMFKFIEEMSENGDYTFYIIEDYNYIYINKIYRAGRRAAAVAEMADRKARATAINTGEISLNGQIIKFSDVRYMVAGCL
jgi:hypothetical protein